MIKTLLLPWAILGGLFSLSQSAVSSPASGKSTSFLISPRPPTMVANSINTGPAGNRSDAPALTRSIKPALLSVRVITAFPQAFASGTAFSAADSSRSVAISPHEGSPCGISGIAPGGGGGGRVTAALAAGFPLMFTFSEPVLMAPSVSQKLFIHDSSWFCFSST